MPYRRLPNTDKARLKALKNALTKGRELPPFKLAFTQKSFQKLQSFLNNYENALSFYRQSYLAQTKKNKEYSTCLKRARIYISHFIQVLNLTILRAELPPEIREFYCLKANESKIPPLSAESDVIKWGERLIKGEARRINGGSTPVTNPSIALVRVRYDIFLEAYHHQKMLKKNTARTLEQLSILRSEADEIILHIWNEVEDSFKELPDDLKREKASEYGVVYVMRKNETDNNSFKVMQSGAG